MKYCLYIFSTLTLFLLGCAEGLDTGYNLPVIQNLSPDVGTYGDSIEIAGINLAEVDSVWVNGTAAAIASQSDNQLTFTIATGSNTGPVIVKNPFGKAIGPDLTVINQPQVSTVRADTGNPFDVVRVGDILFITYPNANLLMAYNISTNSITTSATSKGGLTDGPFTSATFNGPTGLTLFSSNDLLIADQLNHVIRALSGGNVSTIAGNGQAGFVDGSWQQQLQFNKPTGIVATQDFIFVADFNNHAIRILDVKAQAASTLVGFNGPGFTDGYPQIAQLNGPAGLALDVDNNLIIADTQNHSIRKLNLSTLELTTVAGTGSAALINGINNNAQFNFPYDVEVDSQGKIYVADANNNAIRIIEGDSTRVFAGTGSAGLVDGFAANAQFNFPSGLFLASDSVLYIADFNNGAIRKISAQ